MISLFLLILFVLIASGLCSMLEAAILSISLTRSRILADQKKAGSRALLRIKGRIERPIAAIVIVNNTVNIVGSIFVGHKAALLFGNQWLGVCSGCLTFLIILFAEIIPKTLGERFREPVALAGARSLLVLTAALLPLIQIATFILRPITRKMKKPWVTEEEIKTLVRLGKEIGAVELDEERLIHRVFRMNDVKAAEVMTPLEKIYALPAGRTLKELRDEIVSSPHSRIVIYDKNPEKVVGVCQQRMLLRQIADDNYQAKVEEFASSPIFVSQDSRADDLLDMFRAYHQHLFIVQDKKNKNLGIVTMEDVLEELFGEIYDERDAGLSS